MPLRVNGSCQQSAQLKGFWSLAVFLSTQAYYIFVNHYGSILVVELYSDGSSATDPEVQHPLLQILVGGCSGDCRES